MYDTKLRQILECVSFSHVTIKAKIPDSELSGLHLVLNFSNCNFMPLVTVTPAPLLSPSKFIIVPMMMDRVMGKLGLEPIQSISVNLMVTGRKTVRVNEPLTRLHSSRMHTARLLPVPPSMQCTVEESAWSRGEGACLWSGGGTVSQHAIGQTPLL